MLLASLQYTPGSGGPESPRAMGPADAHCLESFRTCQGTDAHQLLVEGLTDCTIHTAAQLSG